MVSDLIGVIAAVILACIQCNLGFIAYCQNNHCKRRSLEPSVLQKRPVITVLRCSKDIHLGREF